MDVAHASTEIWVGLDTALANTTACGVDAVGNIVDTASLSTECRDIHAYLNSTYSGRRITVGLESCSTSVPVAKGLRKLGYDVAIFDCLQIKKFASIRRVKNDANDARSIAEVTRLGRDYLTEVHLKSNRSFEMRAKLVARGSITKQRIRTEQLIRSFIGLHGGRMRGRISAPHLLRVHVLRALEAMSEGSAGDLMPHLGPLTDMAERQREEEVRLLSEIAAFAEAEPVCGRFMEIPGISSISAVSFYTAIEDPKRFARCTDVGAYLGLTPKIDESGERSRHGGISKKGNVLTRTHLVGAATIMLTVSKRDTAIRRWALDRAAVLGLSKARVALARKLATLMFCMWRDGTHFVPEGVAQPRPKLVTLLD